MPTILSTEATRPARRPPTPPGGGDSLRLAAALLFLPVSLVASVFRVWVLRCYWTWFVEPATGAPPPGLVTLFGLAALVHYVVYRHDGVDKTDEERAREWGLWRTWFYHVSLAALVYGIGWVAAWLRAVWPELDGPL